MGKLIMGWLGTAAGVALLLYLQFLGGGINLQSDDLGDYMFAMIGIVMVLLGVLFLAMGLRSYFDEVRDIKRRLHKKRAVREEEA